MNFIIANGITIGGANYGIKALKKWVFACVFRDKMFLEIEKITLT